MNTNQNVEKKLINQSVLLFSKNPKILMKHTRGVQNLIYKYENNSSKYILRVSDSLVRNINEIKSELDFILHLHEDDISVAIPIISQRGKYIESIEV